MAVAKPGGVQEGGGGGVVAKPPLNQPLVGFAINAPGVTGTGSPGVLGKGGGGYGVVAQSSETYALFASGPKGAAALQGDVAITGDVTIDGNIMKVNTVSVAVDIVLAGADCAEHFDVAEAQYLDPGTVVVIDREGALRQSREAYDKKVAGVVSGAGDYQPAIVLDRRASDQHRMPVALVGKVYCKVDAEYASIEVGDLLTTSPTAGHAMKATDASKAFGAVIGKALRRLHCGKDLIPILVALQ
jgi:hypothetical protein